MNISGEHPGQGVKLPSNKRQNQQNRVGSNIIPFVNRFPTNTQLYMRMTTKPSESLYETVKALVLDHDKLAQMSKQAYLCAHTDATLKAVAIIESQVKEK